MIDILSKRKILNLVLPCSLSLIGSISSASSKLLKTLDETIDFVDEESYRGSFDLEDFAPSKEYSVLGKAIFNGLKRLKNTSQHTNYIIENPKKLPAIEKANRFLNPGTSLNFQTPSDHFKAFESRMKSLAKQRRFLDKKSANDLVPTKESGDLRIGTYNVHMWKDLRRGLTPTILSETSLSGIAALIRSKSLDIVALQEANGLENLKNVLSQAFQVSPDNIIHTQNNVIIVLSKNLKIDHKRTLSSTYKHSNKKLRDGNQRNFISALITDGNNLNIRLTNTHLDAWDETAKARMEELAQLGMVLDEAKETEQNVQYIVLGDFNETNRLTMSREQIKLNNTLDSSRLMTEEFNSPYRGETLSIFSNEFGFVDTWHLTTIPAPHSTFLYAKKVDHILVHKDNDLLPVGFYKIGSHLSDHAFIFEDFRIILRAPRVDPWQAFGMNEEDYNQLREIDVTKFNILNTLNDNLLSPSDVTFKAPKIPYESLPDSRIIHKANIKYKNPGKNIHNAIGSSKKLKHLQGEFVKETMSNLAAYNLEREKAELKRRISDAIKGMDPEQEKMVFDDLRAITQKFDAYAPNIISRLPIDHFYQGLRRAQRTGGRFRLLSSNLSGNRNSLSDESENNLFNSYNCVFATIGPVAGRSKYGKIVVKIKDTTPFFAMQNAGFWYMEYVSPRSRGNEQNADRVGMGQEVTTHETYREALKVQAMIAYLKGETFGTYELDATDEFEGIKQMNSANSLWNFLSRANKNSDCAAYLEAKFYNYVRESEIDSIYIADDVFDEVVDEVDKIGYRFQGFNLRRLSELTEGLLHVSD